MSDIPVEDLIAKNTDLIVKNASNIRLLLTKQAQADKLFNEVLEVLSRVEVKLALDEQTTKDVKELERKIRERIQKLYDEELSE